MYVQELWRYPVKSMRGEQLAEATMDSTGIKGDRNIIVVSEALSRIITAPNATPVFSACKPPFLRMVRP